MIWYIVFIILLFVQAIINNHISKKILYPPTFLSLIWLGLVIVHLYFRLFSQYTPYLLSLNTLAYFLGVIIMFSIGGIVAKGISKDKKKKDANITFSNRFLNIILILNVLFLWLFFEKVKELTGSYTNLRMFRYYTSVKDIDLGLIKYGITFSIFGSILAVIDFFNTLNKKKLRTSIIVLSSFVLTILTGSRGSVFFLMLSCLGVYSVYRRVNVKLLFKSILVVLTVFILIATALKKAIPNAYTNKKEYSPVEKVEYFFYSYSTLVLSAFDKFFNEPYEITYGDILFRFPKTVLYKSGIIDTPPTKLVEKYVSVPDRVNVFTAYYKMIKDFGVLYSLLLMMLIGFFHSFFFFNSSKKFECLIGFVVLLFPLVMSFFEENYLSILSTWIQVIVFTFIAKYFIQTTYE